MDRPVYEALFDRAALDRLTALADTDPSLLVRDFADRTAADDVTDPEVLPPDSPLYDLPNVLLTPHIAGSPGNELGRLAHRAGRTGALRERIAVRGSGTRGTADPLRLSPAPTPADERKTVRRAPERIRCPPRDVRRFS
jgi:hypothetical protein